MNNILNIYNIELKRIYKLYLALLGFLVAGNITLVVNIINRAINSVAAETKSKPSIELMNLNEAKIFLYNSGISSLKNDTMILLGLVVILCLIYAVIIWYRDFIGRNKTGYTLFMLPYNKFNIYIAKAITIIVMIYGVIITQILSWVIDIGIIKSLSNMNNREIMPLIEQFSSMSGLNLIPLYFRDFLMINLLGVILAVIVIFTGIMIHKSFKMVGMVLGCMYIVVSMYLFIYLISSRSFTDQYFMVHSIYYIVLFAISLGLSYTLLNKKVYI